MSLFDIIKVYRDYFFLADFLCKISVLNHLSRVYRYRSFLQGPSLVTAASICPGASLIHMRGARRYVTYSSGSKVVISDIIE